MAEIRLNKLIKQFRIGLDTLVDFLEENGVDVKRTPNAKISSDYLPLLRRRFGSDPIGQNIEENKDESPVVVQQAQSEQEVKPDKGKITFPDDIQHYVNKLIDSQSRLIRLAEERRVGMASESDLETNKRLLHRLVDLSHERPEYHDDIQKTVEDLSQELFDLIVAYRSPGKHKKAGVMKADFVIKIRNRYLMALNEMVVDEVLETIEVGWDKVVFQNGKLLLDIGKEKRLVCPLSDSRETYNLFRLAFIQRVPPIQVRLHSKNGPEVVETPEFKEVFQYLKIRDDIRLGSFARRFDLARFLRTSKVNFQETFLPKDRGPYMQFLVEKQSPKYRFIPVYEQTLDHEDAFLFTLVGSRTYIVWENINENTATYVFPVTNNNYEAIIQAIYDYASSDTDYKRMRMHYGESKKTIGTDCRIINHNDLSQWKREILSLI